ncbi:MAG TPA: helix-hairpin-helix domain-containing protein [Paludibacteraceae bacterium]|nr:helix-hairpin-helix domain-containing protein [Paludibacteraceae bacterium]
MWKDFFYFSKSQRIGIIVLIILILLVIIANLTLPLLPKKPVNVNDSTFFAEVAAFKKSLVSQDSLRKVEWEQRYKERYSSFKKFSSYSKNSYQLFPFDPNTADSVTFVRLGLKPYIATNILKYRAKGGKFKHPDDLAKVYGISEEKFQELLPYIKIDENLFISSNKIDENKKESEKIFVIELNSADTTQLMQVKGIGRTYAQRIVRYRKSLGGFVSVDQLKEVYGMTPENYNRILPYCVVDPDLIQKIKVNTANVDRLNQHPYLNFYQAKAIYELRRKKGKLYNFKELKSMPEFSDDELEKIQPYLSFE